jgi:hypothetical protein
MAGGLSPFGPRGLGCRTVSSPCDPRRWEEGRAGGRWVGRRGGCGGGCCRGWWGVIVVRLWKMQRAVAVNRPSWSLTGALQVYRFWPMLFPPCWPSVACLVDRPKCMGGSSWFHVNIVISLLVHESQSRVICGQISRTLELVGTKSALNK